MGGEAKRPVPAERHHRVDPQALQSIDHPPGLVFLPGGSGIGARGVEDGPAHPVDPAHAFASERQAVLGDARGVGRIDRHHPFPAAAEAGRAPAERGGGQGDRADAGVEARNVAAAGQQADAHRLQPAERKSRCTLVAFGGTVSSALLKVALCPAGARKPAGRSTSCRRSLPEASRTSARSWGTRCTDCVGLVIRPVTVSRCCRSPGAPVRLELELERSRAPARQGDVDPEPGKPEGIDRRRRRQHQQGGGDGDDRPHLRRVAPRPEGRLVGEGVVIAGSGAGAGPQDRGGGRGAPARAAAAGRRAGAAGGGEGPGGGGAADGCHSADRAAAPAAAASCAGTRRSAPAGRPGRPRCPAPRSASYRRGQLRIIVYWRPQRLVLVRFQARCGAPCKPLRP
jgi:hypothetical protein